ncbi:MAG: glutathione S-transferase [Rhodobacteraceae bacterium]|nr:glutathione S-transferase [Paracoccaceae bacterium]
MLPVLYSFRRCPYAIRARLALQSSGQHVELREILLRDKAAAFLAVSPSKTVPCLVLPDRVLDESLDIMKWALAQSDPAGWLDMPEEGWDWITRADGPFKDALDRTKYASRHPAEEAAGQRGLAGDFLADLDRQIDAWVFERPSLADFAILPFVRQFANIDRAWFDAQPWPNLHGWLARFLASDEFEAVMEKYAPWAEGDAVIVFPA